MKKTMLCASALLALMSVMSCDEGAESSVTSEYISQIHIVGDEFLTEDTRASYSVSDAQGFQFSWSLGDTIGIYPIGGDQTAFPISGGEGSRSAVFDGGSWALRSSFRYAAYYPFSAWNYLCRENALKADYTGQVQDGNASFSHFAGHDYMVAAATTPSLSGGVDLQMKRLGCLVRLVLTMPLSDTFTLPH